MAGRPKGSFSTPKLRNYLNPKEIEDLVEYAKTQKEKPEILKWLLEQIFGKARQVVGHEGGEEGEPMVIEISEKIAVKNNLNTDGEKELQAMIKDS